MDDAESLTFEKLQAMMRNLPAAPLDPLAMPMLARPGWGMPVYEIAEFPRRIVGEEKIPSPSHPFIHWLARVLPSWLTFDPWSYYYRPVYEEPPFAYRMGDRLMMTRQNINAVVRLSGIT